MFFLFSDENELRVKRTVFTIKVRKVRTAVCSLYVAFQKDFDVNNTTILSRPIYDDTISYVTINYHHTDNVKRENSRARQTTSEGFWVRQ